MISHVTEARTSLGRLNKFLRIEELAKPDSSNDIGEEDSAIRLADGHFKWDRFDDEDEEEKKDSSDKDGAAGVVRVDRKERAKQKGDGSSGESQDLLVTKEGEDENDDEDENNEGAFRLRELNVEVKRGELVAIIGRVGSGKTSILNCMLGEMKHTHGQLLRKNTATSYACQR
jgi:ATP-binding cassette subfamily C (CFTR/MRP) protein 1